MVNIINLKLINIGNNPSIRLYQEQNGSANIKQEFTMSSFVHARFLTGHAGVARIESAFAAARKIRQNFDGTQGVSALLLVAVVSALAVVADQMIDTWADGHLLVIWVALWTVGFAAVALFAGTARSLTASIVRSANAWSVRRAQAQSDARFWNVAQNDPRVMSDLMMAMSREESSIEVAPAAKVEGAMEYGRSAQRTFPAYY
jgi:hypothetical protein